MSIGVRVPADLLHEPIVDTAVRPYLARLVDNWRQTGSTMVRDSSYRVDSEVFAHSSSVKTIMFHEQWQTAGVDPSDTFQGFTFDLANHRHLHLADLFVPGVDPLVALPPVLRPFLIPALAQAPPPHDADTYPFVAEEWEPQRYTGAAHSGFSGDYQAFALTADELVLYLPNAPLAHETPVPTGIPVWSMNGGIVVLRIPLSALASLLRSPCC